MGISSGDVVCEHFGLLPERSDQAVASAAMLSAFAATFLVYWIALLRVRPGMGAAVAPGRNG